MQEEVFAGLREVLLHHGSFTPAARQDPRPDLADDHHRWVTLLQMAAEIDYQDPAGAYGALYDVRCIGARLGQVGNGWRIEMPADLAPAEWDNLRRQWLMPHSAVLWRLLSPTTNERSRLANEDTHKRNRRADDASKHI